MGGRAPRRRSRVRVPDRAGAGRYAAWRRWRGRRRLRGSRRRSSRRGRVTERRLLSVLPAAAARSRIRAASRASAKLLPLPAPPRRPMQSGPVVRRCAASSARIASVASMPSTSRPSGLSPAKTARVGCGGGRRRDEDQWVGRRSQRDHRGARLLRRVLRSSARHEIAEIAQSNVRHARLLHKISVVPQRGLASGRARTAAQRHRNVTIGRPRDAAMISFGE